jgi:hypothetical protein
LSAFPALPGTTGSLFVKRASEISSATLTNSRATICSPLLLIVGGTPQLDHVLEVVGDGRLRVEVGDQASSSALCFGALVQLKRGIHDACIQLSFVLSFYLFPGTTYETYSVQVERLIPYVLVLSERSPLKNLPQ